MIHEFAHLIPDNGDADEAGDIARENVSDADAYATRGDVAEAAGRMISANEETIKDYVEEQLQETRDFLTENGVVDPRALAGVQVAIDISMKERDELRAHDEMAQKERKILRGKIADQSKVIMEFRQEMRELRSLVQQLVPRPISDAL
ncbi:hypothetical protein ABZV77_11475 [Streptomyces sp. NPDC004732]|uniref:hypothetical protein n=1 Tax=Streptomyces sp. NPDC004732 TaxID=3154290 RepID=UPI00339E604F